MDALGIARGVALLALAALWAGSALWVYTDARTRLADGKGARRLLVAALALPFLTPIVYAFARPAESVAERRERELSLRLLEESLTGGERCLVCRTRLDPAFLRCPSCGEEVARPCLGCGEPLKLHWSACPHCERRIGRVDPPANAVA